MDLLENSLYGSISFAYRDSDEVQNSKNKFRTNEVTKCKQTTDR